MDALEGHAQGKSRGEERGRRPKESARARTSCLLTSDSASSCSTLSLIRSNAAIDDDVPTPASMSFTLVAALAVRARAMIWSFLALASAILASSSFMLSYSDEIDVCCPSTCRPPQASEW